jgi:D-alanyl-D-alanine carboxypeptidase (penicillin-binding protein 5/6)
MLLGRDPSVDGMKTGYTDAAGLLPGGQRARDFPARWQAPAAVGGAGHRLARGPRSRKPEAAELGLAAPGMRCACSTPASRWPVVPVWKGKTPTARLGTPGAIHVTVPKGEGES